MLRGIKPLLFAMLCLIWGSTWLVIKVGYGGLGAFNVAALRFLVAGIVMLPITMALGVRWPRGRTEWGLVVFVGAILFAVDYGLIYWAELSISSGLTAVLFAVMPIFTVFAAHLYIPAERLTSRKLGGTLLAFAGVAALFADQISLDASNLWPMLAVVVSALAAALGSVASKRHGTDIHPAALNAPAMLVGGVMLAAASLAVGDGFALPTESGTWWGILYLAVAGSVITFLAYFHLLKTWDTTTMSFIAVFTPLVALGLGVLIDEQLTAWMGVGTALILGGVTLALTTSRRTYQPTMDVAHRHRE